MFIGGEVLPSIGAFKESPIWIGGGGGFVGETWYVDPSAAGSSENGTTANPYLSLNGALAGKCNKTFTTPIRIKCRTSGSTPDTVRCNDSGLVLFSASAANYLEIIADTGNSAGALWDATKYHLYPAYSVQAGTALALSRAYMRVEGLQIGISTQTGAAEICYMSNASTAYMKGCLVRGANSSEFTRGLSSIHGVNLINCVFFELGSNLNGAGIKNHGNSNFYSCTILHSTYTGIDNTDGTSVAKNCYVGGGAYQDYSVGGGSLTLTTCASSDTTGSSGLTSKAVNTTNFVNVTAGSTNLNLPGGSALLGVGTDTSGDAAPFNFTTDINGTTRTVPWSVGADE